MNPFAMNGGEVASDLRSGRPGLRASGSDEEEGVSVANGTVRPTPHPHQKNMNPNVIARSKAKRNESNEGIRWRTIVEHDGIQEKGV